MEKKKVLFEMKPFLAHIAPGTGREQTLLAHAEGVAAYAAAFAAPMGASAYAARAAYAHDAGKYTAAWQAYLRRAAAGDTPAGTHGPDHSTAGAKILMEQAEGAARFRQIPAALCVMGHHAGLPDYGGAKTDTADMPTLCGRLKRTEAQLGDFSACRAELPLAPAEPPALPGGLFSLGFFTRMLYSCLVDADFLDTEAFLQGAP